MSDILSWRLAWLEDVPSLGENNVLGTKIRVHRNLSHLPFPLKSNAEDRKTLVDRISTVLRQRNPLPQTLLIPGDHLGEMQKGLLVESGLVDPDFFEKGGQRVFGYSETGADSLFINHEDHLVIQVFLGGLAPISAWEEASAIAGGFEHLGFAFDQELGYLTASPRIVGTGLQTFILLDLPALEMTRQSKALKRICLQKGCCLERYASWLPHTRNSFFVLSNGQTLGKREEEILEDLQELVIDIVAREQRALIKLREEGGVSFEDKLWRTFGAMRCARYVDFQEALSSLSIIRMGMSFAGIPKLTFGEWKRLIMDIHPTYIRAWSSEKGLPAQEKEVRAYRIRKALKEAEKRKQL